MKTLKSKEQIKKLLGGMRSLNIRHTNLCKTNEMAYLIPKPKLTSVVTEPLVLNECRNGKLFSELQNDYIFKFGNGSDLVAEDDKGNQLTIEVKATQEAGFSQFNPKDVAANYLVWLDFGDYTTNRKRKTINVYTLANPSKYFPSNETIKIKLETFLTKTGDNTSLYRYAV